jgi:GTPase SAR1 family protein
MFDSSLVNKPSILVLNKIDTDESNEKIKQFHEELNNYNESILKIDEYWRPKERIEFNTIIEASIKNNINIDKLCLNIRELLDTSSLESFKKTELKHSQNSINNQTNLI